jgi:hypothetical protein
MATIAPHPRLKDVENAANFIALTADNFEVIAAELAKREPTYAYGSPTTVIGPPTAGARVLREFWRDALGGEWLCAAAGTPGTWTQITPAPVTADPTTGTIPVGYLVFNTSQNLVKQHQGGYVWTASGASAHTHQASDITDSTTAGRGLLTAADAAAQRTALGLGNAATKDVGTAAGTVAAGDHSHAAMPLAHSTLAYAASVAVDLNGDPYKTLTLTGDVAITTTNRAALRMVTVRIIGDSSQRTLTLSEAWKWIGAAKPTTLAAGKVAVLSLTAFGSAESDVIAAYAVEP